MGFKYYFLFICLQLFLKVILKLAMEGQAQKQEQKITKIARKKGKLKLGKRQDEQQKLILDQHGSQQDSDGSKVSSGWSSEVIQPAIKTMAFRSKRGTRMKELIRGKHKKDLFWDKYQNYFGGDLNKPDDSEDQEDYQASSSGRDQFDSDFDLTDSYVGKRGRKKGTKVKRRKKVISKAQQGKEETAKAPKGRRGRKKKIVAPLELLQQQKEGQQLKVDNFKMEESQPRLEDYLIAEEAHPQVIDLVEISSQLRSAAIKQSNKKSESNSEPRQQTANNPQLNHPSPNDVFEQAVSPIRMTNE